MDNQCIQHRVSYITLTLTHVVSMLRNFPLGSSRITWSQCYELHTWMPVDTRIHLGPRGINATKLPTWMRLPLHCVVVSLSTEEWLEEKERNTAWQINVLCGYYMKIILKGASCSFFFFFFPLCLPFKNTEINNIDIIDNTIVSSSKRRNVKKTPSLLTVVVGYFYSSCT